MGLFDGIGALFGGAPNNANFQAQGAPIMAPVTMDQANASYDQTQNALLQQQQLAQALQAQGGMGMNSQAALTNMLMQQAQGGGPNPAQNMLNQSTGQNVANQAALMASQRGAGANVGLMARQAAQQGAGIQQNAVGQAATLGAQQQLNAQNQLQSLAGNQIGQQAQAVGGYNQAAQGQQANLLNSIANANKSRVDMQSNVNNANSGMAQTNANNSAKFLSGAINSFGGAVGAMFAEGGMVDDHMAHMANLYHGNPKLAMVPDSNRFAEGAIVPGKAKENGDSYSNDTVPAMLSPGEIIIPRHITQGKNAPEEAKKFVEALIAKNGGMDDEQDFKEALKKAISTRGKKSA